MYLGLVTSLERLFQEAVSHPDRLNEQAVADRAADLFIDGPPDRELARAVRRALRATVRMRDRWSAEAAGSADWSDTRRLLLEDWRARVDEVGGPAAWRRLLDVAQIGLDREPGPELFEVVAGLFRVVHNTPYLDGIDFEAWMDGRELSHGPDR